MKRGHFLSVFLAGIWPLAAQLPNPGFESGLEGWVVPEKVPVSSVSEENPRTGKAALRVADDSLETGANVNSERFPVSAGQKVTLSFYANFSSPNLGAVMLIPFTDGNRPILNENGKPPVVINLDKGTGEWTRYEAEYLVPDEAVFLAISLRTWTKTTGQADFDDFELTIE